MKQFQAAVKRAEAIEFELDGDVFHFTPPKMAGMALALIESGDNEIFALGALMDWLGAGLAEGESDKLIGRLKDPTDPIDIPDLSAVVQWLMEEMSGRPFPSSSDSGP